jgi:hypothetical protein
MNNSKQNIQSIEALRKDAIVRTQPPSQNRFPVNSMKTSPRGALIVAGAILLLFMGGEVIGGEKPSTSNGIPGVNGRLDEILQRLDSVDQRLDSVEVMLEDPAPTAVATFCFSQSRDAKLEGELAAELKANVDGGIGWAEVASAKLVASPSWPLVLPLGPLAVPIPTLVKVGLGGDMGRVTQICIDIPIKLTADDKERLRELAKDINNSPLGLPKSKFQRRAHRLVNYIARQVPGIQVDPKVEASFDTLDEAFVSLMDEGLQEPRDAAGNKSREGLGVFRDSNIRQLLDNLDMPVNVVSLMNDPEQIFDALPDLVGGFDSLTCENLGVSERIRSRPRMEKLCQELDKLPSFDKLRDGLEGLPDEIVDAIAENLSFFLEDAEDKREQKKSEFCNSTIGKRRVFDKYCGR